MWWGELADARFRFARLINAQPHEIAILPNVGVALSVIASSLDYAERPRDRGDGDGLPHPALPVDGAPRGRSGAPAALDGPHRSGPGRLAAAINTHTALVATTHVFFTSGWIQDIAAIAELAHNRGALCLVDGYQAAGQLPVDVKAAGVDIYLSGGLKWLLGGPGVVFMYVREELIDRLEPTTTGWFAAKEMFKFNPVRFERADDARRFEPGTPAVAAVYAANAGMSIIEEIGPAAVRARTRELVADLAARLRAAGLAPRLPQDMDRHAGIVMLPAAQPAQTVAALKDRRIIVDHRPGAVRLSPYFYNTEAENQAVVDAIGDALASQGAEDGP